MSKRDHSRAVGADGDLAERAPAETTAGIVTFRAWQDENAAHEVRRLPMRYDVRDGDAGRYLRCKEAPGVGVALDRSYAFSETEARKLGERVILLDGAGQFGPLIDSARQLYNLDHHDHCLRAFTLATCEQALVLVLKGLELDRGDWRILANEPDLDTLFAIWVLLNHRRLRALEPAARDRIVQLLRLEGAIDANGYEVAEYCGLPHQALSETRARLDTLLEQELALKRDGDWGRIDLCAYTCERLIEIDHLVYEAQDFDDFASVDEEYGHVEIGGGRVAVVCRDGSGIYDVEKRLKQVWADRLGIIALAKGEADYTLRRAASLADIDLGVAYDRLNQLDPAVDGHPPAKRWGGSDDIGGSPRPGGTGLAPEEIAQVLQLAYRPASGRRRLLRLGLATVLTTILGSVLTFAGTAYRGLVVEPTMPSSMAARLAVASAAAILVALALSAFFGRGGGTWRFGWRWPAGEGWVLLVPAVLAGAVAGGVWMPLEVAWHAEGLAAAVGALALSAVALALWFQGLVHGLLAAETPTQIVGGRWFLSEPALVSALLYAALTATLLATGMGGALPAFWPQLGTVGTLVVPTVAAFGVGLALAMIRERTVSVLPAIAGLFLGALVRIGCALL